MVPAIAKFKMNMKHVARFKYWTCLFSLVFSFCWVKMQAQSGVLSVPVDTTRLYKSTLAPLEAGLPTTTSVPYEEEANPMDFHLDCFPDSMRISFSNVLLKVMTAEAVDSFIVKNRITSTSPNIYLTIWGEVPTEKVEKMIAIFHQNNIMKFILVTHSG